MHKQGLRRNNSATALTIPEFGRAYLKAALNHNNEEILLHALNEIQKSFLVLEQDPRKNETAGVT